MLSAAGVTPRIAQELMRHSDIRLTMKVYTDVKHLPTFDAIKALPSLNHVTYSATKNVAKWDHAGDFESQCPAGSGACRFGQVSQAEMVSLGGVLLWQGRKWYARRESNPKFGLRRPMLYPFNYRRTVRIPDGSGVP